MEDIIKNITSDADYKTMTLDEAAKYGKTFEHFNARFEVKEVHRDHSRTVRKCPVPPFDRAGRP